MELQPWAAMSFGWVHVFTTMYILLSCYNELVTGQSPDFSLSPLHSIHHVFPLTILPHAESYYYELD